MTSRPRRLHRAAVLAEALDALKQMVIPLVAFAIVGSAGSGNTLGRLLLFGLAGLVIATVTAYVQWQTTWWEVDEQAVRLRRGVLNKRETTIPFERVQAVDLVRGPVQRLFGVVELHVQAAGGGGGGEIVLKAVAPGDADELREAVARRGGEAVAATVEDEAPAQGWRLERAPLLVAALTSGSLGVLVPVVAGASQVLDDLLSAEVAEQLVPGTVQGILALGAVILLVAWALSFLGTVVQFARFEVVRDGDRLRIRRGVVERRESSVPVDRIHALRVVESPLRQPLGVATVRVETAGYAEEPATAQTLLPLVRRDELAEVLGLLVPELAVPIDGLERVPGRAVRPYLVGPVVAAAIVSGPVALLLAPAGLAALSLLAIAVAFGLARHRAAGWAMRDGRVVLRGRWVARTTTIARSGRVQLVQAGTSPLQRRARLATLAIGLSSSRRVRVAHLDGGVAEMLLRRLASAAVGVGRR